jgi:hypothetical protein
MLRVCVRVSRKSANSAKVGKRSTIWLPEESKESIIGALLFFPELAGVYI